MHRRNSQSLSQFHSIRFRFRRNEILAVPAATATGLTVGGLTISATELAILVGGAVAITGIVKGCKKITFNPDGSVTMEF